MITEAMKELLFPRRCPICDDVLRIGGDLICEKCIEKPRKIEDPVCLKCGKPLEEEKEFCEDCVAHNRSFQCGRSLFVYDAGMRRSISYFKYRGRREYAWYYGRELARRYGEWLEQIKPEGIIPVPLHAKRMKKRGYNQAELVADVLGTYCHIPVFKNILFREKNTIALKTLNAKERRENLDGAFAISDAFEVLSEKPKCVILLDDIYTTGSTIDCCSKVLCRVGVKKIYFLCICTGQGY